MPSYDAGSDWKRNKFAGTVKGPNVDVTGRVTSSGVLEADGIGYRTGAGSTVTQLTNKTTGVTINAKTGTITMNNAQLTTDAIASFAVTNSAVGATDLVVLNHNSVATLGKYLLNASTFASGSFQIDVTNISTGSLSEAIVIRFAVIKSVNA